LKNGSTTIDTFKANESKTIDLSPYLKTVNDSTVTIKQGTSSQSFTLNKSTATTISIDPVPVSGIQVNGVTQSPTSSRIINLKPQTLTLKGSSGSVTATYNPFDSGPTTINLDEFGLGRR